MCYYLSVQDPLPALTLPKSQQIETDQNVKLSGPTALQLAFINYRAADGLRLLDEPDERGRMMVQVRLQDFAKECGVSRQTLWNWEHNIPNFWGLVREQRKILFSGKRESAIWKGVMLRAMKGDHQQATMILTHFGDYKLPTQKIESEFRDFASVLRAAEGRGIIEQEAEVVSDDDGGSSPQDS